MKKNTSLRFLEKNGEASSPQKESTDIKIPGQEHQPRVFGKNQTSKNPIHAIQKH